MSGVRLRPLVEVVEDAGGALYLLRGPAGGDCVIREPPAGAAALLRALEAGGTPSELAAAAPAAAPGLGGMLAALDAAGVLEPLDGAGADERLSRQLLYLGDRAPRGVRAAELQARLTRARVAILGCGGLGSWVAAGLACSGIGHLTLVDDDVVELSNLNRQLLFAEADVGRPKVDAAAAWLRAFDGGLDVAAVRATLASEADVAAAVAGADVVAGCADRPPYAIARWINRACARAGTAHISAGQLPPTLRVGPLVVPGATACLACLELALREENPLYGRLEALRRASTRPLATTGPASGVVGQLVASELVHHLTGLVRPGTCDAVWTMDLRTLVAERTPVVRRSDCPVCAL
jgi:bacteriocin biosynthesis cyclodehydratase domain-containing protein